MSNYAGWLGPAHAWVLAAHVTFVIFWMAGLFLLPRLYVYTLDGNAPNPTPAPATPPALPARGQ